MIVVCRSKICIIFACIDIILGAGKTSLVLSYCRNEFSTSVASTIGAAFLKHTVFVIFIFLTMLREVFIDILFLELFLKEMNWNYRFGILLDKKDIKLLFVE